ncbi:MAG: hypothetical protein HRU43_06505 [Simkaniaceae bacterium]|nr:hypothetical protein [Simkaniaceae bacterium]
MMQYGNKIYPLVAKKHPELAGKITGMFLGTGLTEFNKPLDNKNYLQQLCENPDFMEAQIKEAIFILEQHHSLKSVGDSVKNKMEPLIFRRINYVQSFHPQRFLEFPSHREAYRGSLHSKVWKQYGVEQSEDFHGFTSHFCLREFDLYKGKQMPFSKQGYAVLDPITLQMTPTKYSITPRIGDLICGIVDTTAKRSPGGGAATEWASRH